MSKGAVGLTAGYWPDDVHRYLATPGISLDEGLTTRPAKRTPDRPALLTPEGSITYGELSSKIDEAAKALLSFSDGKAARFAIAVAKPTDLVKLLFAAFRARGSVFLINPSLAPQPLEEQLRQFNADFILTDDKLLSKKIALPEATRFLWLEELEGKGNGAAVPKERLDLLGPAIALPMDDGGLAYHSHKSLLAGAVSWSSFVPLKADDLMLALQPLYTWEGIYSLFPILFRGGSCLLADLEDPERTAQAVRKYHPLYTILPRPEARKLYESPYRPLVHAFREILRGLFVSVLGPFTALGRRRLKSLLDKPALLTYGSAEAGAIFSSHPTWYLDAAVGMPITNVDVWPLNPETGNPLEVPWETIEYGEVGVKSPMTAVGFHAAEEKDKRIRGGWLRTKIVATMDPNGLFYIQSKVSG